MVRAGGIARRRADAAILLPDQLGVGQLLTGGIAPELAPHALVEVLGAGFGEAVGERLQHDARVIVVRRLELRDPRLDAEPRGHRERPDVVAHARVARRDVSPPGTVRLPRRLGLLLAQLVQRREHRAARVVRIDLDVVTSTEAAGNSPTTARTFSHFLASNWAASAARPRTGCFAASPTTGSVRMSGNLPANSQALKNGIQSMCSTSASSG